MKSASWAGADPVIKMEKTATLDANRKLRIGLNLSAVNIAAGSSWQIPRQLSVSSSTVTFVLRME